MNHLFNDEPELNITPLVDIMLVLMAILMVTAPTVMHEEKIKLPQGSKSQQIKKNSKITIKINNKKEIYIKNNKYKLGSDFADNFIQFSQKYNKKTPIHILASKDLIYKDVIYVLKSIKEAGFSKVSLITN